jgi:hypothetical protein
LSSIQTALLKLSYSPTTSSSLLSVHIGSQVDKAKTILVFLTVFKKFSVLRAKSGFIAQGCTPSVSYNDIDLIPLLLA